MISTASALRGGCAILTLALVTAPASAEPILAERALDLHLWRLVFGLIICIALAIASAFLLKRAAKRSPRGRMQFGKWLAGADPKVIAVLETRRVSMHGDACRLSYAGREYLVLVTAGGATLLKETEALTVSEHA